MLNEQTRKHLIINNNNKYMIHMDNNKLIMLIMEPVLHRTVQVVIQQQPINTQPGVPIPTVNNRIRQPPISMVALVRRLLHPVLSHHLIRNIHNINQVHSINMDHRVQQQQVSAIIILIMVMVLNSQQQVSMVILMPMVVVVTIMHHIMHRPVQGSVVH